MRIAHNLDRVLEAKRRRRRELAALPSVEKIRLIETMRERNASIARNPLRAAKRPKA
ncbi:MAG: hypothetical protein HUU25_07585 [Candidatus Sumerlaeia bacterium]|nr:hypothetical protein [Candidatus Sumerlaeia bacterium]